MDDTTPDNAEPAQSDAIDFDLLDELFRADDLEQQASGLARVVLSVFEHYYARSRHIPELAKAAFQTRNWRETVRLSRHRLTIYAAYLDQLTPVLRSGLPEVATDESLWELAEREFLAAIFHRYEADFAFAFWHSLRRVLLENEWRPIAYDSGAAEGRFRCVAETVIGTLHGALPIDADLIRQVLDVPGLDAQWRDIEDDARRVAQIVAAMLQRLEPHDGEPVRIEMANAGFYRNRGATLIGRIHLPPRSDGSPRQMPLMIALLNGHDGIFVDAVLCESDEIQYAFSSTLANYHATNPYYHELAQFLAELMPKRPLGLHYSTIGFHHLGKVAVMKELLGDHARGETLDTAPGFRGTVAIGFSMPSSRYVLKIIRDRPTEGYKWGEFAGLNSVLDKYRLVHEMDRAGSMLDNIIYSNVKLDRAMFAPSLLDELLEAGVETVSLERGAVVFKHLIVQLKLTPLPLFLASASHDEARTAVINLGDCIKNNAAANIFNKDLDGRNYGVSGILKVYLFDYDAVEPLTEVKVRTNADREPGEEDIPDWYFEDGTIFLPEETISGLRIDDARLRRMFLDAHPDITTVAYWEAMQQALREGKVPPVRSYPAARRLRRD